MFQAIFSEKHGGCGRPVNPVLATVDGKMLSREAHSPEIVSFVVADVERFSRIDIDPWFETGSRRPTPLEIITRRGVGM